MKVFVAALDEGGGQVALRKVDGWHRFDPITLSPLTSLADALP